MPAKSKLTRILSIDGGGIRGILPGQILVALEEILQRLDENPNARIADYFDLIAGTNTGGILACIYLCPSEENSERPKYSAGNAVNLFLERGDEIFDVSFWDKVRSLGNVSDEKYSVSELEEALDIYFGDIRLSELLKPCLITAYDIRRRKGHFFRSHRAKTNTAYDFLVRETARATSATPTYFEVARMVSYDNTPYPLIDGGVFVNNPALCAYAEARNWKFDESRNRPRAADMMILSLGTGGNDKGFEYKKAKKWSTVQWITPIIDITMSGVVDTIDYPLRVMFDEIDKPHQYLRISPTLYTADSSMDNASLDNLDALRSDGVKNTELFHRDLTAFAKMLVANK